MLSFCILEAQGLQYANLKANSRESFCWRGQYVTMPKLFAPLIGHLKQCVAKICNTSCAYYQDPG
jgi:hypothetical protein